MNVSVVARPLGGIVVVHQPYDPCKSYMISDRGKDAGVMIALGSTGEDRRRQVRTRSESLVEIRRCSTRLEGTITEQVHSTLGISSVPGF